MGFRRSAPRAGVLGGLVGVGERGLKVAAGDGDAEAFRRLVEIQPRRFGVGVIGKGLCGVERGRGGIEIAVQSMQNRDSIQVPLVRESLLEPSALGIQSESPAFAGTDSRVRAS